MSGMRLRDLYVYIVWAITKTRNGESGKGIGERGMGNEEWKNPEY